MKKHLADLVKIFLACYIALLASPYAHADSSAGNGSGNSVFVTNSSGGSTASPAYSRVQDATTTNLGTVDANGATRTAITNGSGNVLNSNTYGSDALFTGNPMLETVTMLAGLNAPASAADRLRVDGNASNVTGALRTADGGNARNILTSSSATSCTSIQANTGRIYRLINATTTALTQTISIYDEGSSPTCAAADLVYTAVLGASQVVDLHIPLTSGAAYTLSAALTGSQTVVISRN